MKTAAFYTLGCKVNQYETEAMTELFKNRGYEIVKFEDVSDVYVINTCTVTGMSDRKSRQIIRRAKKANPNAVIAVTGCYAQTAPEDILKIDGVNLIVGTNERHNIVDLVESADKETPSVKVGDIMHSHEFEELSITTYSERTRAYIKIQEGCSQFCTYCIIPYARGPVRSREPEKIIAEIKNIVKNGFSEIILTGIHVASYGVDLENMNLAKLLKIVNEIDGVERIRLSSIEPMTLNEDFISAVAGCNKLCHHFHLSLQSGCNETLKRMNRKYTVEEYKNIVDGLRAVYPDVAITTDIMVGFPGETDEEFEKCAEFVREIDFSDAHIFQYSPRKGTPAAKRRDQIDPAVKEKRSKVIAEITKKSRDKFLCSFIGKTYDVLFEQPMEGGFFEGKTDNYITVAVKTDENLSGKNLPVILEEVKDGIIYGKAEKKN